MKIKVRSILILILFLMYSPWSVAQTWEPLGDSIPGDNKEDAAARVSLSADGSTLAIGATGNDAGGINSGHVRIYTWNGTDWVRKGNEIRGEAAYDLSGSGLSLNSDGSRVAIGAIANDGKGFSAGHVRVYEWNGTSWTRMGSDIDGRAAGDRCGYSVSLSADGSIVAIGSPDNNGGGTAAGQARVYAWDGTKWVQRGFDIFGEASNDQSGIAVSLNGAGNRVAIGASFNAGNGPVSGHVRIFRWNDTSWVQVGNDINGEKANDQSGWAVSLSQDGMVVAIGATMNDDGGFDAGQVRVYTWDGTAWIKTGQDLNGKSDNENFGNSVSLSSDGKILAVGAPGNSTLGNAAGAAQVYFWNGTSWETHGDMLNGTSPLDLFGATISMSADGNILAVGAPQNDTAKGGEARVFRFTEAGAADHFASGSISAYPNPSGGTIHIDLGHTYPSVTVRICNILGETKEEHTFDLAERLTLNTGLPPGVYLTEIILPDGQTSWLRLVINR